MAGSEPLGRCGVHHLSIYLTSLQMFSFYPSIARLLPRTDRGRRSQSLVSLLISVPLIYPHFRKKYLPEMEISSHAFLG